MSAGPQLQAGAEVVLVEDARSYTCGRRSPALPKGARAEVESTHWDGGDRLACIVTVDANEHGYRRFAIVAVGSLALVGVRTSA